MQDLAALVAELIELSAEGMPEAAPDAYVVPVVYDITDHDVRAAR